MQAQQHGQPQERRSQGASSGEAELESSGPRITIAPSAGPKPSLPKVGRNDPCPCGSGKKFKQCCGRMA